MKTKAYRMIALICALLLAAPAALCDAQRVRVPIVGTDGAVSAPYDDDYFSLDNAQYHHKLAQSSFGMALAAFRGNSLATSGSEIRAFLSALGFIDIRCDQYDQAPTEISIASAVARKTLGAGEDAFTLLAVPVSGGNYGMEWLSNFTVGDDTGAYETVHKGFYTAAQQVLTRVYEYISAHHITGRVKVWTSGYSRSAAVSNILAAELVKTGLVAPQDIYGYSFATPATIAKPGDYQGIYCVVGQFDPVGMVPIPDWGFTRYGTTLRTPARETDSDYDACYVRAQIAAQWLQSGAPEADAQTYCTADDIASQLRAQGADVTVIGGADGPTVIRLGVSDSAKSLFHPSPYSNQVAMKAMALLAEIVPDKRSYVTEFQSAIKEMYANRGNVVSIATSFISLLNGRVSVMDMARTGKAGGGRLTQSECFSELMDMAGGLAGITNTDFLLSLVHEHFPQVYAAWMLSSDDPDEIFTQHTVYRVLRFPDSAAYAAFDASGKDATGQLASFAAQGSRYLVVPQDKAYTLTLRGEQEFDIISELRMAGMAQGVREHMRASANQAYTYALQPVTEDEFRALLLQ